MELHLTENRVRTLAGILVLAIALAIAGGASIAFVHPLVPFAALLLSQAIHPKQPLRAARMVGALLGSAVGTAFTRWSRRFP